MPSSQKIKDLLFQTVYKKAAREAARILVKSSPSPVEHVEAISYKNIIGMILPRVFDEVRNSWQWVTGDEIPVTLQEAMDYYERHVN